MPPSYGIVDHVAFYHNDVVDGQPPAVVGQQVDVEGIPNLDGGKYEWRLISVRLHRSIPPARGGRVRPTTIRTCLMPPPPPMASCTPLPAPFEHSRNSTHPSQSIRRVPASSCTPTHTVHAFPSPASAAAAARVLSQARSPHACSHYAAETQPSSVTPSHPGPRGHARTPWWRTYQQPVCWRAPLRPCNWNDSESPPDASDILGLITCACV